MTATSTRAKNLQFRTTSVCFGGYCFWTRQLRIKAFFISFIFCHLTLQPCMPFDFQLSYFHHQSAGGNIQCQRRCSGSDFACNYLKHLMRVSLYFFYATHLHLCPCRSGSCRWCGLKAKLTSSACFARLFDGV